MAFPNQQAIIGLFMAFLADVSSSLYMKYYPGTNQIERAAVNKSSKSWQLDLPYYPPAYSKPCESFDTCDASSWIACPNYNYYGNNVDRRSATFGTYKVNDKCDPLNPRGRTGIRGRGGLLRYGPNHRVVVIISRNGQQMEYVGKSTEDQQILDEFPWEFTDEPKALKLPRMLEAVIKDDLQKKYPVSTVNEIIEKAKKKKRLVYRGYYHDERNTDNAWIETWLYEIKDPDSKALGLMSLEDSNTLNLTWKKVDAESFAKKIDTLVNQARLTKGEKFVQNLKELVNRSKPTDPSILLDLIGNIINIVGISATFSG
ncbi:nudix hydrolase 6 [Trichuris trichiura]|uniref:Nudix hydrolase 6 n=1 Tax=Trichuris trichiura TaxID=36087 RepID=A0A077YVG3_TRITR|nr:nudix hydrolase 6 [Trichuris trichiura]